MDQISTTKPDSRWHYRPDLNSRIAPYYSWPPEVMRTLRHLVSAWSLLDVRIYVLGFSLLAWHFLSPALARCQEFSPDWIAQIWLRNFVVMTVLAGGLHLYFHTFKKQGSAEKYDSRELTRKAKNFHFKDQLRDNMFWTLVGTVGFLSLYESLMMWAYANGATTVSSFQENPAWFILLLLLTPGWTGLHFYWQHRLFHVPVFYRLGHHWHHKNVNVGPWSGAAVHPLENLVWFTAVLVLLLVPSHPIHALFLMQLQVITAITTHCGYDQLIVGKHIRFRLGDFFHQLHHRFYDCNYGTMAGPWDRLFGTYHDGTPQGDARIEARRRMLKQTVTEL